MTFILLRPAKQTKIQYYYSDSITRASHSPKRAQTKYEQLVIRYETIDYTQPFRILHITVRLQCIRFLAPNERPSTKCSIYALSPGTCNCSNIFFNNATKVLSFCFLHTHSSKRKLAVSASYKGAFIPRFSSSSSFFLSSFSFFFCLCREKLEKKRAFHSHVHV